MAIRFNSTLNKLLAVQCYEVPRFGLLNNKYQEPDKVKEALTNRRLMAHCAFDSRVTEWTGN
jgi:hypothetical protein